MNIDRALPLALTALVLAGCTPIDRGFGESQRVNIAAQTIDPEPVHANPAETSGDQAARAVERYRTGTVKEPRGIRTSRSTSGAGSSGGVR